MPSEVSSRCFKWQIWLLIAMNVWRGKKLLWLMCTNDRLTGIRWAVWSSVAAISFWIKSACSDSMHFCSPVQAIKQSINLYWYKKASRVKRNINNYLCPVVAILFPPVIELELFNTGESLVFTGLTGFTPYFWMSEHPEGNLLPFHSQNVKQLIKRGSFRDIASTEVMSAGEMKERELQRQAWQGD